MTDIWIFSIFFFLFVQRAIGATGKGILPADESTGTITNRLSSISVESTFENYRAYRELLFTTEGLGDYISGVILYCETLRQKSTDNVLFPELLTKQGILPGIKVDSGAKLMSGFPGDTDLHLRGPEYYK